jgi:hypothetical protein
MFEDRVDVHDKMLQASARDITSKNGHQLGAWIKNVIGYGGGRKKRKKFVDTYRATCKHCTASVQVSNALQERLSGEALEDYCTANVGYEDRMLPLHYEDGCGGILRVNHDSRTAYLRDCA